MKSALVNGRIAPPPSLEAALKRLSQLRHESKRIEGHLDDITRPLRYPSIAEYDAWAEKAKHALKLFRNEADQLDTWVKSYEESAEGLLMEANKLFAALIDDEMDFDDKELNLIERISNYVENRTSKPAAVQKTA